MPSGPGGAVGRVWDGVACAAGLPRICVLKRCRRKKRCLGAGLICVRHHEGLQRKRYASALARLGW